jgi:hypothetical protein
MIRTSNFAIIEVSHHLMRAYVSPQEADGDLHLTAVEFIYQVSASKY